MRTTLLVGNWLWFLNVDLHTFEWLRWFRISYRLLNLNVGHFFKVGQLGVLLRVLKSIWRPAANRRGVNLNCWLYLGGQLRIDAGQDLSVQEFGIGWSVIPHCVRLVERRELVEQLLSIFFTLEHIIGPVFDLLGYFRDSSSKDGLLRCGWRRVHLE